MKEKIALASLLILFFGIAYSYTRYKIEKDQRDHTGRPFLIGLIVSSLYLLFLMTIVFLRWQTGRDIWE